MKSQPQYQSMWGPKPDVTQRKAETSHNRSDQVWAEEAGCAVRITDTANGGAVQIEIMTEEARVAIATLGRWRWERLVRAVEVKP